jgi:predicted TIM-barrel fold metal-dependent hydrolase
MRAVIANGPEDRLMMATDDPWGHPYGELSLAGIMKSVQEITAGNERLRRKIMGENATKLLKID